MTITPTTDSTRESGPNRKGYSRDFDQRQVLDLVVQSSSGLLEDGEFVRVAKDLRNTPYPDVRRLPFLP